MSVAHESARNNMRRTMTVGQAADRYGVPHKTILKWIERGHFSTRQDPYSGMHFFDPLDFEAFLARKRGPGRPRKEQSNE